MGSNFFLSSVFRGCKFSVAIVGIAFSPMAVGHGFGQRYDLPVPLWLWVIGAGATIVLSFVILGVVSQNAVATTNYSRVNLLKAGLMRGLAHSLLLSLIHI